MSVPVNNRDVCKFFTRIPLNTIFFFHMYALMLYNCRQLLIIYYGMNGVFAVYAAVLLLLFICYRMYNSFEKRSADSPTLGLHILIMTHNCKAF